MVNSLVIQKRLQKIIFDLTRYEDPPNKLLLGAGVLSAYREKLDHIKRPDTYESITLSADFQNNE